MQPTKRILAIDLTSRGFGFAVMEGPFRLIDWGVKQPRPYDQKRCVAYVEELVSQYRPHAMILEDCSKKRPKRSPRVTRLFNGMARRMDTIRLPLKYFTWKAVKMAFNPARSITKYEISRAIATLLPVLVNRLPPIRKPWMSEDYRMAIFDAVALALTFYHSTKEFRNVLRQHEE